MTDRAAVHGIVDAGVGETEGFAAELGNCVAAALRLARTTGCSADEAADAAQEAAIAAWRHRDQLRGDFRPWFLAIVHRQALRRRRWWTLPVDWGAPTESWPADDRLDSGLVTALRSLPARQRTALWLRYGLDMSTADTAEVMKTTETAMKQLLLRSREALRRRLGERP